MSGAHLSILEPVTLLGGKWPKNIRLVIEATLSTSKLLYHLLSQIYTESITCLQVNC